MPAAHEKPTGLVTTSMQPAVDPSQLPSASDTDLIFEPASRAEYEQTWRLNADEWKGFLSHPSYLDREIYLGGADLTRDGNATGWLLTHPKFPRNEDDTRPILSSCECILKNAYVARDGKVDKVLAHGIGSVYCRPEHRGRGYAQRMMKELGTRLETWQQPKSGRAHFSVLYSDIGPKFYARQGWKVFPSDHVSLKPVTKEQYEQHRTSQYLPEVEDLTTEGLTSLPLIPNLESKLAELSQNAPEKTFVAFRPDTAHFQWHFMREEFLSEYLGREKPVIKGAVDRKTGLALIWTRTYSADASGWHLSVLYVHVPQNVSGVAIVPSLAALLLRAQYEAFLWEMNSGIEIWEPREELVTAAQTIADDVKVITRDQEHICSLKWYGPETDDVVWLANERYAWC
ncbi:hypothetical protein H2198_009132 [Neophaeococcomyces mojaviensis]|uniref:Uncharacterized protein n=1 Tax=Neophaeococcomyces mojaviensis TaxID=3383035 RepID=A0ACC2ZVI2_9EURO|nr:hypothetical protein H2198_009132 [Knufia sp. JES_112]